MCKCIQIYPLDLLSVEQLEEADFKDPEIIAALKKHSITLYHDFVNTRIVQSVLRRKTFENNKIQQHNDHNNILSCFNKSQSSKEIPFDYHSLGGEIPDTEP